MNTETLTSFDLHSVALKKLRGDALGQSRCPEACAAPVLQTNDGAIKLYLKKSHTLVLSTHNDDNLKLPSRIF